MIYLDNAATSYPKPPSVAKEAYAAIQQYGANPGRSGHTLSARAARTVFACREALADFFGCGNPERILFTKNATESLNLALKGLLKRGDGLIITSMEHNSVLRPAARLQKAGVAVTTVYGDETGVVPPEKIEAAIRGNTRLICVTGASNVCGSVNDIGAIGEIARRHGVLLLVDAAQTAGVVPIDVEAQHIDLLAFPGHKGLLGPQGSGGLFIREGLELSPLMEGGTGTESELLTQPATLPERFESGTLSTPAIAGLLRGVEYLRRRSLQAVFHHERQLTRRLLEDLSVIANIRMLGLPGIDGRVGTIAFVPTRRDCINFSEVLDKKYRIASRAGLHCAPLAHKTLGSFETGAVRLSVGPFNTMEDVKSAVWAIMKEA